MSHKVYSVEYTLLDPNTKEVIESNKGHEPLEFITGLNQMIPGFEAGVVKLSAGEEADILVKAEDAYGLRDESLKETLPREQFQDVELEEGMYLYGTGQNGETIQVTVVSFTDNDVTIDYNHPMAGKDLLFNVKVIDVRDATEEEINTGVAGEEHCGCGTCGV